MFSVRIVTTDHYQSDPIPGLDVGYSEFRADDIKKVPVFRIFGSTPAGQKTCMHVHGVFPYLYVPYDGTQPWERYLRQFASSLDKAINVALGSQNSKNQHVYKISIVSGIPMYGYHSEEQQFLKIFLYNPNMVRKAADLLLGGAVMNKMLQPHESHIPYNLQFFMDYNLYGMNMINAAAVKFRHSDAEKIKAEKEDIVKQDSEESILCSNQSEPKSLLSRSSIMDFSGMNNPSSSTWKLENLSSDMFIDAKKLSTCELEVDAVAADIINRLEVNENVGTNPGLAALWEDERQRRKANLQSSQIGPQDSQERDDEDCIDTDKLLRERLKEIVLEMKPFLDSQSDGNSVVSVEDEELTPDIPATPASEVDFHLSQDEESFASQSTVVFDDIENEESLPVININSIKKVLSMSQSFTATQTADTEDKSLADILASLAGEGSPSSSQETVPPVALLEEHDSILQSNTTILDEKAMEEDDLETAEMSQQIWESSPEEVEENSSQKGFEPAYNLEGLDATWNESQMLDKGNRSTCDDVSSDDDIPQLDGPVDKKPDSSHKRKRLGTRGPVSNYSPAVDSYQQYNIHGSQHVLGGRSLSYPPSFIDSWQSNSQTYAMPSPPARSPIQCSPIRSPVQNSPIRNPWKEEGRCTDEMQLSTVNSGEEYNQRNYQRAYSDCGPHLYDKQYSGMDYSHSKSHSQFQSHQHHSNLNRSFTETPHCTSSSYNPAQFSPPFSQQNTVSNNKQDCHIFGKYDNNFPASVNSSISLPTVSNYGNMIGPQETFVSSSSSDYHSDRSGCNLQHQDKSFECLEEDDTEPKVYEELGVVSPEKRNISSQSLVCDGSSFEDKASFNNSHCDLFDNPLTSDVGTENQTMISKSREQSQQSSDSFSRLSLAGIESLIQRVDTSELEMNISHDDSSSFQENLLSDNNHAMDDNYTMYCSNEHKRSPSKSLHLSSTYKPAGSFYTNYRQPSSHKHLDSSEGIRRLKKHGSAANSWTPPSFSPVLLGHTSLYTFIFRVPTPAYKRFKYMKYEKHKQAGCPNIVRMHPQDARRYSLLKIGKEIVEVKRLSIHDIIQIRSELKFLSVISKKYKSEKESHANVKRTVMEEHISQKEKHSNGLLSKMSTGFHFHPADSNREFSSISQYKKTHGLACVEKNENEKNLSMNRVVSGCGSKFKHSNYNSTLEKQPISVLEINESSNSTYGYSVEGCEKGDIQTDDTSHDKYPQTYCSSSSQSSFHYSSNLNKRRSLSLKKKKRHFYRETSTDSSDSCTHSDQKTKKLRRHNIDLYTVSREREKRSSVSYEPNSFSHLFDNECEEVEYESKPKRKKKKEVAGVHYIVVGRFKGYKSMKVKLEKLKLNASTVNVSEFLAERDQKYKHFKTCTKNFHNQYTDFVGKSSNDTSTISMSALNESHSEEKGSLSEEFMIGNFDSTSNDSEIGLRKDITDSTVSDSDDGIIKTSSDEEACLTKMQSNSEHLCKEKHKRKKNLTPNQRLGVAFLSKKPRKKRLGSDKLLNSLSVLHQATLANLHETTAYTDDTEDYKSSYDHALQDMSLFSPPDSEKGDVSPPNPDSPSQLTEDNEEKECPSVCGMDVTDNPINKQEGNEDISSVDFETPVSSVDGMCYESNKSPGHISLGTVDSHAESETELQMLEDSDVKRPDSCSDTMEPSNNKLQTDSVSHVETWKNDDDSVHNSSISKHMNVNFSEEVNSDVVHSFSDEHETYEQEEMELVDLKYDNSTLLERAQSRSSSCSFTVVHNDTYSDISDDEFGQHPSNADELFSSPMDSNRDDTSPRSKDITDSTCKNLGGGKMVIEGSEMNSNCFGTPAQEINSEFSHTHAECIECEELITHSVENVSDQDITKNVPICAAGKKRTSKKEKNKGSSGENSSQPHDKSHQEVKKSADEHEKSDFTREVELDRRKIEEEAAESHQKIIVQPVLPPPLRIDVTTSALDYDLSVTKPTEAFCSDPTDLPDKPRDVGGRMLKLQSNLLKDLKEYEATCDGGSLKFWRAKFVDENKIFSSQEPMTSLLNKINNEPEYKFALLGDQNTVISPCFLPPKQKDITEWSKGRIFYKKLKKDLKNSNLTSSTKTHRTANEMPMQVDADVTSTKTKGKRKEKKRHLSDSGIFSDTRAEDKDVLQFKDTPEDSVSVKITKPTPIKKRRKSIENSDKIIHSTPVKRRSSLELIPPVCTPISGEKNDRGSGEDQFVTPKPSLSKQVSSNTENVLRRSLLLSQLKHQYSTPLDTKGQTSQIDRPTPNNTYGFKVSQDKFQDAKALHEFQHLTICSMELHVESRGDLTPDPECDAIQAVFYNILNDIPEDKGQRNIIGAIVVDKDSSFHRNEQHSDIHSTPTSSSHSSSSPPKAARSRSPKPSTSKKACNTSSQQPSTSSCKENIMDHKTKQRLLEKSGVAGLEVLYVKNEEHLLEAILDLISKWDPDILVGYEIQMLSWGYLLQRASKINFSITNKISRIPDSKHSSRISSEQDEWGSDHSSEIHIGGRIVLNLWRILRHETALNIYTFENVAFHVLHKRIPLFSHRTLNSWFNHKLHVHRWRMVDHYITRVKGNLELMDQFDLIGRTSEFARVFGIEFYHVLSRGSQYRVESMMLRLAKPMNYIPVSPNVHQRARMRAPECIPLTLEPESNFYTHPVVVVDFQSLYPSIMIAYNYCFTTCLGRLQCLEKAHEGSIEFGCTSLSIPPATLKKLKNDVSISPNGVVFLKHHIRKGVLPRMVEEILNTRLMVKKAMKDYKNDKGLHRLLNARQLGLKLIANVTYGYTGANFSGRMPCIEVGDSIVRKARETLERSIKLVEDTPRWRARVIYGDTDSMFILLKGRTKDEAFKIGQEIADTVTHMNPKPVKLKFEKVYMPCVLQTKKRYAGFSYETPDQKEPIFDAKGIETVRRDSCSAVSKMLEKCLKILFTVKDISQVKSYVLKQFQKIMEGKVGLQDYIFAKEFRGMKGYKPGACVPALEIARKLVRQDKRAEPRAGSRIPYIIVYGSPGLPLIQLIRQPAELLKDPSLRLNSTYYISKQILPPLNRVFSLLGVDVFSWFNEMPKTIKISAQVTSGTSKGTISQYFSIMNCPICDKESHQPICKKCSENPQLVSVVLNQRIRDYEQIYEDISQICCSCMGLRDINMPCVSFDCPILFRSAVAKKDIQQSNYYREILEKSLVF